jgi:cystathionine beta-lyase/cystathionine gamma-synthase
LKNWLISKAVRMECFSVPRMSVGIEEAEDLIGDLAQALGKAV